MNEKKLQVFLSRIVLFLREKYAIDVQFVDGFISVSREVAEWRNNRMIVDVRERGTLGSLFVVCHVFGHLVQHSTTRKYSDLLAIVDSRPLPLDLDNDFKSRYFPYEKEAFQIGKGLMEEVFEVDSELDRLYQIFIQTDFEHYWNYLVTGRGSSREAFNRRFRRMQKEMLQDITVPLQSIKPPETLQGVNCIEIIVV